MIVLCSKILFLFISEGASMESGVQSKTTASVVVKIPISDVLKTSGKDVNV